MNYELNNGKGDRELLFSQTREQMTLSQSSLKLEELIVSAIASSIAAKSLLAKFSVETQYIASLHPCDVF
ncbi:MAG TPA: hypothetical protein DEV81_22325 [Cyanobacteria bacterium UBA11049]|nr:hypothetical protein [Cyanobacteria bacterium UBA11049]